VAQATTIAWAKLKYNPKPPERSRNYPDGMPQHYATAVVDGYDGEDAKAGLYFAMGVYSYLQVGDLVMVEWNRNTGKWKFAKQQTPELLAMLNERQAANPELLEKLGFRSASSSPTPSTPTPSAPSGPRPSSPIPKEGAIVPSPGGAVMQQRELVATGYREMNLDPDVQEFLDVFQQLREALPGADPRELFTTARGLVMERGKNARSDHDE